MSREAQQSGSSWPHHGLELLGWSLALVLCWIRGGRCSSWWCGRGTVLFAHGILHSSSKCSPGNNHVASHKGFLFPAADSLHQTMKSRALCILLLPPELWRAQPCEGRRICLGWSREAECHWAALCFVGQVRLSLGVGLGLAPPQSKMGMCSLCPTCSSALPTLCLCFSLKRSPSECWDRFSATKTPSKTFSREIFILTPSEADTNTSCFSVWGLCSAPLHGCSLLFPSSRDA